MTDLRHAPPDQRTPDQRSGELGGDRPQDRGTGFSALAQPENAAPARTPTPARSGRHAHLASLPNLLTYGRVVAVPLLAISFYLLDPQTGRLIAALLFAAAAVTDFFDGYLARAWEQQSNMGRMLDPIADKLLVAITLMILVGDGTLTGISLAAALVILAREIVVSGLREFLAELNVKLHVSWLAKWKTLMQMLALFALLLGPALGTGVALADIVTTCGVALLWLSAALTLYTGLDYLKAALRHVR